MWSAGYGATMTAIDTVFHVVYVLAIAIATNLFGVVSLITIAWLGIVYGLSYGVFMLAYTTYKGWLEPYRKGIFRSFALKVSNFSLPS